ncbi:MAG: lipid-A-disaccharide synthase [Verrucomicrobia bacterium]|nr:lipid-A-disaccharide synthase [Verrucomicrobiota bacterium]
MADLFILAAEPSADLQGAALVEELLKQNPELKIAAVSGPRMRQLPIETVAPMETLQVMGFTDVLFAMPRILRQFFFLRDTILQLKPKAVVCIDYPGFNLRLEKALRKKKYTGQLIHYICPAVWAWGKNRIPKMAKTLDLLLSIFPFEKKCFEKTPLNVEYIGHPLTRAVANYEPNPDFRATYNLPGKILGVFPGSRQAEIERNFPVQLETARALCKLDPELQVAISVCSEDREAQVWSMGGLKAVFIPPEHTYDLMRNCHLALAKSGTVTLELALHEVPTVVTYAIKPIDVFLAQKIFHINLPHYCIVNIIASEAIYPELFGPNLTYDNLYRTAETLLHSDKARDACRAGCAEVKKILGNRPASETAAQLILSKLT